MGERLSDRQRRQARRPERERSTPRWLPTRSVPRAAAAIAALAALAGIVVGAVLLGSSLLSEESGAPPPVEGDLRVTPSGLGIIDITEGTGPSPQPGNGVAVQYTGWLSDGTMFGSSLDSGEPFEFIIGAGRVIKGWDEGILTMKVGGKRRLIIPPELAYGEAGRPPDIPPNAELTFDVALLAFK